DSVVNGPGRTGLLNTHRLSKSFGGLTAVDSVTIEIPAGAITAIIGPNGAGKSTLFNLVTGALKPSGGNVYFAGEDVTGWPAHRVVRAGLSRTFQNVRLFENLTVVENVMAARFCRTRSSLLESVLFLPRARAERHRSREVAEQLLH